MKGRLPESTFKIVFESIFLKMDNQFTVLLLYDFRNLHDFRNVVFCFKRFLKHHF
jgi:hypothetical protein